MKKIRFLVPFLLFIFIKLFMEINEIKSFNSIKASQHSGLVDSVYYTQKRRPIYIINGFEHDTGLYWISKEDNISKGDSLFKESNSIILEHYKFVDTLIYLHRTYKLEKSKFRILKYD